MSNALEAIMREAVETELDRRQAERLPAIDPVAVARRVVGAQGGPRPGHHGPLSLSHHEILAMAMWIVSVEGPHDEPWPDAPNEADKGDSHAE